MSRALYLSITFACTLLAGCAVGPDYVRPEIATPEKFKEAAVAGKWVQLDESTATEPEQWWKAFKDPVLDALINTLVIAIDEEMVDVGHVLAEGEKVELIPPIAGG